MYDQIQVLKHLIKQPPTLYTYYKISLQSKMSQLYQNQ